MDVAALRTGLDELLFTVQDLARRLAAAEKKIAELQKGQPLHMARVERRIKPTINGHV